MPEAPIAQDVVLPPGGYFAAVVEPGQRLRLEEVEDQQVADLMSFNRTDPREQLSMYVSRAVARNWKLTAPHRFYSAPSCEDNLERALAPYGLDRWRFNPDTCFNVFMNVAYEPDHRWEIREPRGRAGDYMVLRALMPQIVAISNCPQIFNPCNAGQLKPLKVRILA